MSSKTMAPSTSCTSLSASVILFLMPAGYLLWYQVSQLCTALRAGNKETCLNKQLFTGGNFVMSGGHFCSSQLGEATDI